MPPPPAQGWDSIMIPQPGTPTSRLWSEDQSTANGTMPAVQRPSDARHSASVDSETDGIHTVDSKSREERKGRSQHITTIPDASSRRRGPNTDRSGTANDRRLHSNDHPVSQETIGKRLKFLQKHRDHQSDLFIKYTDSLEHFSMKQQSPVKAVAELEAKAEAAGEELDLYDQWIKELKGGIVGASTSRPANSRSEVGGLATTSNQRVPTTPTTTVNGTPANTKVHALGLPDDDDADLEEMDCA